MTSRHRNRVAIASAMFVLTSCMESPVVDLTRVRVGGIGFESATLVAQLQVDNPNRFGIKTDSVTFELQARDAGATGNWTRVAAGTYPRQFEVAGRSSSRVDIPIELAYSALSTPVRSIIQRGRFDYRLTGQVFVRRPFPKRVPFTQDGSLSIFESR